MKMIFKILPSPPDPARSIGHLAQNTAEKTCYQFFKVYDMIRTIHRYFTGKKVFSICIAPVMSRKI